VAAQFKRLGLRPLGDTGSYIQSYPLPLQRNVFAPNVVGLLEGRDPALRGEYIVFSAHMDHVGVGEPVNGDSIYNGADDNASGTTAVLALAEAFAHSGERPRRSLIFLTVSGEERGLWGSAHFTSQPPVAIDSIAAAVNIDMIGRNWPDTIVAIGKEHSDLGTSVDRVAAVHPELRLAAIDDPWPNEQFYYRSDHYNFARRGVPVLFFFNGTHGDYHEPGDEPQKIDVEKATRVARLLYYFGLDIANATPRPIWNPESYRRIVGDR
jgi:Zn-dependent M28 family amino/carboxypeptidase